MRKQIVFGEDEFSALLKMARLAEDSLYEFWEEHIDEPVILDLARKIKDGLEPQVIPLESGEKESLISAHVKELDNIKRLKNMARQSLEKLTRG